VVVRTHRSRCESRLAHGPFSSASTRWSTVRPTGFRLRRHRLKIALGGASLLPILMNTWLAIPTAASSLCLTHSPAERLGQLSSFTIMVSRWSGGRDLERTLTKTGSFLLQASLLHWAKPNGTAFALSANRYGAFVDRSATLHLPSARARKVSDDPCR